MPFSNFTEVNIETQVVGPMANFTDATITTARVPSLVMSGAITGATSGAFSTFVNVTGQANVGSVATKGAISGATTGSFSSFVNITGAANVGSVVTTGAASVGTLTAAATNTTGKTNISGAKSITYTNFTTANITTEYTNISNAIYDILQVIKGL